MFLDIKNIGEGSLDFDQALTLMPVREGSPDVLEAPTVRLQVVLTAGPRHGRPAEGACLAGRLDGELRLRCCRCLEPFERSLGTEFRLTLRSEMPVVEDADHHVDTSETGFFEIEDGKIDLETVATEQVYLNLPQKPLCRPFCASAARCI